VIDVVLPCLNEAAALALRTGRGGPETVQAPPRRATP